MFDISDDEGETYEKTPHKCVRQTCVKFDFFLLVALKLRMLKTQNKRKLYKLNYFIFSSIFILGSRITTVLLAFCLF